jgi:hypothetical protein
MSDLHTPGLEINRSRIKDVSIQGQRVWNRLCANSGFCTQLPGSRSLNFNTADTTARLAVTVVSQIYPPAILQTNYPNIYFNVILSASCH